MISLAYLRHIADVSGEFDVPRTELNSDATSTILRIVFGVAGGVAVIIILLASLKYITSRGDPGEVAKAKNTIIYAAIGLVVIAFAFSIVGFVVNRV